MENFGKPRLMKSSFRWQILTAGQIGLSYKKLRALRTRKQIVIFIVTKLRKIANMPPCQEDSRSFFEKLQNAEGLDLRDNRGKRHDLAVV